MLLLVIFLLGIMAFFINVKFAPLFYLSIGVYFIVFPDKAIEDFKRMDWWDIFMRMGENTHNDFYSRRTFRIFGFIALLVGIYELAALFVPWLV